MGAGQECLDEQMAILLHIYVPRWFNKTRDGVKWSSGCGVTAYTIIWVLNRNARKGPMHPMPQHIYGPRQRHRSWDGANRSSGCGIIAPARIWVPDVNARKGPMDQWPCWCTFASQASPPKKFRWSASVQQLQHLSEFGCPMGMPGRTWCANDHAVLHVKAVPLNPRRSESVQP